MLKSQTETAQVAKIRSYSRQDDRPLMANLLGPCLEQDIFKSEELTQLGLDRVLHR